MFRAYAGSGDPALFLPSGPWWSSTMTPCGRSGTKRRPEVYEERWVRSRSVSITSAPPPFPDSRLVVCARAGEVLTHVLFGAAQPFGPTVQS